MYKFSSAAKSETIVFGAARPGYSDEQVAKWIDFMQNQSIQSVCCLLPSYKLNCYSNLLETYRHAFGTEQVCWAPIEDFLLVEREVLIHQILPFLAVANRNHQKVVVHCSGGIGRTGHVLVAWLVAGRGVDKWSAITSVIKAGRNPYEAIMAAPLKGRLPWQVAAEFNQLMDDCIQFESL
jgi:protein-tyrosine phosphatase